MSRGVKWGMVVPGWVLFGACIAITVRAFFTSGGPGFWSIFFISFLFILAVALFAGASNAERIAVIFERLAMSWRGFRKTGQFRVQSQPEGDDDA